MAIKGSKKPTGFMLNFNGINNSIKNKADKPNQPIKGLSLRKKPQTAKTMTKTEILNSINNITTRTLNSLRKNGETSGPGNYDTNNKRTHSNSNRGVYISFVQKSKHSKSGLLTHNKTSQAPGPMAYTIPSDIAMNGSISYTNYLPKKPIVEQQSTKPYLRPNSAQPKTMPTKNLDYNYFYPKNIPNPVHKIDIQFMDKVSDFTKTNTAATTNGMNNSRQYHLSRQNPKRPIGFLQRKQCFGVQAERFSNYGTNGPKISLDNWVGPADYSNDNGTILYKQKKKIRSQVFSNLKNNYVGYRYGSDGTSEGFTDKVDNTNKVRSLNSSCMNSVIRASTGVDTLHKYESLNNLNMKSVMSTKKVFDKENVKKYGVEILECQLMGMDIEVVHEK